MRIERQDDVAVVVLEWGKANAMNLAFLDALNGLLDETASAGAVVITAQGPIFSAGLDLPSLVDLSPADFRVFIDRFSDVMLRIFELPLPVVAAVNGHAIAGGCALALQADVRIMADGPAARIGLNEAQLGLGLPPVILEALRSQVPARSLVPIALEGRLHTAGDALRLGLVDALSADVRAAAVERARELARPGAAQIKAALRAPVAAVIRAAGNRGWTETWFAPAAQERIRSAVARLTKRQAPAGP